MQIENANDKLIYVRESWIAAEFAIQWFDPANGEELINNSELMKDMYNQFRQSIINSARERFGSARVLVGDSLTGDFIWFEDIIENS